jgi:hypothetical protein
MKIWILLLISTLFSLCPAGAVEGPEVFEVSHPDIFQFKACRGFQSTITDNEMDSYLANRVVPGPFDSLGEFIDRVDKLKARPKTEASCDKNYYGHYFAKPSDRIRDIVGDLARETRDLVINDVEAQSQLLKIGEVCSEKLSALTKGGQKVESVQLNDFSSMKGQSPGPEDCLNFAKDTVPELAARLELMRVYLAIANGPPREGQLLTHDKPATDFLTSKIFPGVWKKGSQTNLTSLSADELGTAKLLAENMSPELANKRYFQILSTTPILVFFDNKVAPEQLKNAYQKLREQSRFDLQSFRQSPPQDMMLKIPYVLAALEKIPTDKRGDACRIVNEMYRNLVRRYEQFPQFVTLLSLSSLLLGNAAELPAGAGILAKVLANKKKIALMGSTALIAKDPWERYGRAIASCSAIVMETNPTPGLEGICDFYKTDRFYRAGEEFTKWSAIGGAGAYGGNLAYGKLRMLFNRN